MTYSQLTRWKSTKQGAWRFSGTAFELAKASPSVYGVEGNDWIRRRPFGFKVRRRGWQDRYTIQAALLLYWQERNSIQQHWFAWSGSGHGAACCCWFCCHYAEWLIAYTACCVKSQNAKAVFRPAGHMTGWVTGVRRCLTCCHRVCASLQFRLLIDCWN